MHVNITSSSQLDEAVICTETPQEGEIYKAIRFITQFEEFKLPQLHENALKIALDDLQKQWRNSELMTRCFIIQSISTLNLRLLFA